MRTLLLFVLLALTSVASGCGSAPARVKGRLVSNGEPLSVPALQVAVTFTPVEVDGRGKTVPTYTTPINGDGSFEVVVSGGELPPGTYRVTIETGPKLESKFKPLVGANSRATRELKPGLNEIVLDVTKPEG